MKDSISFLILIIFSAGTSTAHSLSLDQKLNKIMEVYDIKYKDCRSSMQPSNQLLIPAGKEIFRSKILSGDKDVSCSTCHIESKHLIDGLRVSVGVGGYDEGRKRMMSGGTLVPRNSFTLIGRSSDQYNVYFWDGNIELDNGGHIISPFGKYIDKKFDSLLSVAAIMPLLARDEFLGKVEFFNESDNIREINDKYYQTRYEAASKLFKIKLKNNPEFTTIKQLLVKGGVDLNSFTMADIGNALSAFIGSEFNCKLSNWNRYLKGEKSALSNQQKKGAVLFFGKARCAGCHNGDLFSDFDYHSIASPQGLVGTSPLGQDLGRANITNNTTERYKFRTPPLLDVKNTAPYGHSGQFDTLKEIVMHHFNPVLIFNKYKWKSDIEKIQYGKILGQRDSILTFYDLHYETEVDDLIEFLKAL